PYPDCAGCVGVGMARPRVEAPGFCLAMGEDRVLVVDIPRGVGERGEADIERRLHPITRRLGIAAELVCRDVIEVVQVGQLPVRNFGADSQDLSAGVGISMVARGSHSELKWQTSDS